MLEDYSAQAPTAIWNTVRGVWETTQKNLLCEHWELFLETWPTSGTMRNGVVYAQPMQAHRMEGIGFSSRLGPRAIPTPTVSDAHWSDTKVTRAVTKSQPYRGLGLTTWADRAAEGNLDIELLGTVTTATSGRSSEFRKGANHNPAELAEDIANGIFPALPVNQLLRTPVADENGGGPVSPAMDKAKGQTLRLTGRIIDLVEPGRLPEPLLATPTTQPSSGKCRDHGGDLLHDVTCGCPRAERREKLLPTVMANEAEKGTNLQNAEQRAKTGQVMITNVAQTIVQGGSVWGQYEPAIRRWEAVTGREAPAPTLPDGRDGQQRLSPLLTEWMMGLPEGWITSPEIGISRNDQIKAAGNGVVPQQAVLALRYLLRKGDGE